MTAAASVKSVLRMLYLRGQRTSLTSRKSEWRPNLAGRHQHHLHAPRTGTNCQRTLSEWPSADLARTPAGGRQEVADLASRVWPTAWASALRERPSGWWRLTSTQTGSTSAPGTSPHAGLVPRLRRATRSATAWPLRRWCAGRKYDGAKTDHNHGCEYVRLFAAYNVGRLLMRAGVPGLGAAGPESFSAAASAAQAAPLPEPPAAAFARRRVR